LRGRHDNAILNLFFDIRSSLWTTLIVVPCQRVGQRTCYTCRLSYSPFLNCARCYMSSLLPHQDIKPSLTIYRVFFDRLLFRITPSFTTQGRQVDRALRGRALYCFTTIPFVAATTDARTGSGANATWAELHHSPGRSEGERHRACLRYAAACGASMPPKTNTTPRDALLALPRARHTPALPPPARLRTARRTVCRFYRRPSTCRCFAVLPPPRACRCTARRCRCFPRRAHTAPRFSHARTGVARFTQHYCHLHRRARTTSSQVTFCMPRLYLTTRWDRRTSTCGCARVALRVRGPPPHLPHLPISSKRRHFIGYTNAAQTRRLYARRKGVGGVAWRALRSRHLMNHMNQFSHTSMPFPQTRTVHPMSTTSSRLPSSIYLLLINARRQHSQGCVLAHGVDCRRERHGAA